jgi:hypothetical protein
MSTTWIQIMRFARALEDGRRAGLGIEPGDAERLVSMLLEFQRRALHERLTPAQGVPIGVATSATSSVVTDQKRPG